MNLIVKPILFCLIAGKLAISSATAQTQMDWKEAGQLKIRHAKEIAASTWSIGSEILDMDFTDYHEGPVDKYASKSTTITIENARFEQPFFVELITAKIYEIPKAQWTKSASKYAFTGIPVSDDSVVISGYS